MKIKNCTIHNITIPFKMSFKHSLARREDVNSIVFEIELESGIKGYGECVPRKYVTGETVLSVMNGLKKQIIPKITGLSFDSWEEVLIYLKNFIGFFPELYSKELCTRAAFELAMIDAAGKEFSIHAATMFGGKKKEMIKYSAIVSAELPEKVEKILELYNNAGFTDVKIKVGNNEKTDTENILLARKIMGDSTKIRVDANSAWDLFDAQNRLKKMADLGVVSCEQPMPASLKEKYPVLCESFKKYMHINIDESLCSIEDGKWFAENNGATMFNLRVSKNGGIISALELWEIASKNKIKCQLGAQVGETSILSSAGRILASITGNLLFHEGSFGKFLLHQDLTEPSIEFGIGGVGKMEDVEKNFGLGIDVDTNLLSTELQNHDTSDIEF